jgi:diguanylate cyclase (GGDEF)-like protein
MKNRNANKRSAVAFKALAVAVKTSVYSYRMAMLENSFESIIGMEDELTGLPNRRAFNNYISNKTVFAVALIDCDSFKTINDTYGHERGDEVLRTIGAILKDRKAHAFRLGGDEFVVVFENGDGIAAMLEDIRSKSRAWAGITLSVGVCAEPGDTREMMKKADVALYRSKERGRDAVSYWNIPRLAIYSTTGRG